MTTRLRSFLLLRPAPGRLQDTLDLYRDRGTVEAAFPYGVLPGLILVPATDPEDIMVTSVWADESGYESWCASAERAEILAALRPLPAADDAMTGWTGPDTGSPPRRVPAGCPSAD
ncbi:hypothetical protein [Streptomyces violaceusniger]|uniref:hypothetical protein n=1 Tax=Streptomyces violaceusniger TaxID=68280 RepID=UPI0038028F1F